MNIAYGRLWWVVIGSFFASALPAFNMAWDKMPLTETSSFGQVTKVASIASIEALRAGIPAVITAMIAFFMRQDADLPAFKTDVKTQVESQLRKEIETQILSRYTEAGKDVR
jgi:hypothetical protein